MGKQRSLLKTMTLKLAGRRHACKGNRNHPIIKGDLVLAIKPDRDEFQYCSSCAKKMIATARALLVELDESLD